MIPDSDVRVVLENRLNSEETVLTPSSVTATEIVFSVPAIAAGPYNVRARFDPIGETNSLTLNLKAKFNPTSY